MSSQSVLHPVACLAAGAALLLGNASCSDHAPRYRAQLPEHHQQPVVAPGTILFVLSATDEQALQNGKLRATGNFLGELYEPYAALTKAGYAVEVATPGGQRPSLDPESLNDKYWGDHPELRAEAKALMQTPGLTRPLSVAAAVEAEHSFQGMLIPGGQGLMVDLLNDLRVHSLIQRFAESDRPVGLICHAPALLTRFPASHPLSQRRVTSVSGFEEFYIETFVMGGQSRGARYWR